MKFMILFRSTEYILSHTVNGEHQVWLQKSLMVSCQIPNNLLILTWLGIF